jgi:2-oxoglutarate dehydrogenase complex dehydrogenase (E1) component-like enzyme
MPLRALAARSVGSTAPVSRPLGVGRPISVFPSLALSCAAVAPAAHLALARPISKLSYADAVPSSTLRDSIALRQLLFEFRSSGHSYARLDPLAPELTALKRARPGASVLDPPEAAGACPIIPAVINAMHHYGVVSYENRAFRSRRRAAAAAAAAAGTGSAGANTKAGTGAPVSLVRATEQAEQQQLAVASSSGADTDDVDTSSSVPLAGGDTLSRLAAVLGSAPAPRASRPPTAAELELLSDWGLLALLQAPATPVYLGAQLLPGFNAPDDEAAAAVAVAATSANGAAGGDEDLLSGSVGAPGSLHKEWWSAGEVMELARRAYTGRTTVEYLHMTDRAQQQCVRDQAEADAYYAMQRQGYTFLTEPLAPAPGASAGTGASSTARRALAPSTLVLRKRPNRLPFAAPAAESAAVTGTAAPALPTRTASRGSPSPVLTIGEAFTRAVSSMDFLAHRAEAEPHASFLRRALRSVAKLPSLIAQLPPLPQPGEPAEQAGPDALASAAVVGGGVAAQRRPPPPSLAPSADVRLALLQSLTVAEAFEAALQSRHPGIKRFSLEGAEGLVPLVQVIVRAAAKSLELERERQRQGQGLAAPGENSSSSSNGGGGSGGSGDSDLTDGQPRGVTEIVFGMAHRGRLNLLASVMGKGAEVLGEFSKAARASAGDGAGGGAEASGDGLGTPTRMDAAAGGDVKYHLGYEATVLVPASGPDGLETSADGVEATVAAASLPVKLTLLPNPSHLETVTPVVAGAVKARQAYLPYAAESAGRATDSRQVLGVVLHGDGSFAGQGLVAETLVLSELEPYATGGLIHIVVNNQIAFTTPPQHGRTSTHPTDVAKVIGAPILHVNGDDPDALYRVARQAVDFRTRFGGSVVINLVCYRKRGHNEQDDPFYTQPERHTAIAQHPVASLAYAQRLCRDGVCTAEGAIEIGNRARAAVTALHHAVDRVHADSTDLNTAAAADFPVLFDSVDNAALDMLEFLAAPTPAPEPAAADTDDPASDSSTAIAMTGLPMSVIRALGEDLTTPPARLRLHPGELTLMQQRRRMLLDGARPVNWAAAEALALGSLVRDGVHVRLTGQDVERGTFSQRHAVVVDQDNESDKYNIFHGVKVSPLAPGDGWKDLAGRGTPAPVVANSPLSEAAALGFEYGYALTMPTQQAAAALAASTFAGGEWPSAGVPSQASLRSQQLVLWEAQFGDFANCAQAVIDCFLASGESKWGATAPLALLLPHGLEGQGPDHSSARPERLLQLIDESPRAAAAAGADAADVLGRGSDARRAAQWPLADLARQRVAALLSAAGAVPTDGAGDDAAAAALGRVINELRRRRRDATAMAASTATRADDPSSRCASDLVLGFGLQSQPVPPQPPSTLLAPDSDREPAVLSAAGARVLSLVPLRPAADAAGAEMPALALDSSAWALAALRFEQARAWDAVNMHVATPSTPASLFHLLRRHALRSHKPLAVMTPKGMLHDRQCVSALADMGPGTAFQPVLGTRGGKLWPADSAGADAGELPSVGAGVERVWLCSGKVYYKLLVHAKALGLDDAVVILRLEQLSPFPGAELAPLLRACGGVRTVVWVQEEPRNQGYWAYVQPRIAALLGRERELLYAGRPAAAAGACGHTEQHKAEETALYELLKHSV